MDNEIKKSNRIPGCDQLTRPEEIKELSRFLSNLKNHNDEISEGVVNLDRSLSIPGKTTGKIPKIEFPNSSVGLTVPTEINIDNSISYLEIANQDVMLDDTSEKLKVNQVVELNNTSEKLSVNQNVELEYDSEKLEVNQDVELDYDSEKLKVDQSVELDYDSEKLEVNQNVELDYDFEKLEVDQSVELDYDFERLEVDQGVELDYDSEKLEVDQSVELDYDFEKLEVDQSVELDYDFEKLSVNQNVELDYDSEKLSVNQDVELDNTSEKLNVNQDVELDNTSEKLSVNQDVELDNTSEKLNVNQDVELSDLFESLLVDNNIEITEIVQKLDVLEYTNTPHTNSLITLPFGNNFPDPDESPDVDDSLTSDNLITNNTSYSPIVQVITLPESINEEKFDETTDSTPEFVLATPSISSSEKTDVEESSVIKHNVLSSDLKLENTISIDASQVENANFVANNSLDSDQLNSLTEIVNNQLAENESGKVASHIPWYKLPGINMMNALDVNNYIRYLVENSIGYLASGESRELLVNEALALAVLGRDELEKLAKAGKSRLPGDDYGFLSDAVSGGFSARNVINSALGAAASQQDPKLEPVNRPKINSTTGLLENSDWEGVSNRVDVSNLAVKDSKILSTTSGVNFKDNYLQGSGITTTLEELCKVTDLASIGTVEELFKSLKSSPYITTPDKFTDTKTSSFKTFMLDTNSYWEMIFTPYVGTLNGFKTFLPPVWEINRRNMEVHGVKTNYEHWIPFTSFDLQKARLTSKSLNLYDGDIMFPISMDFVNEFRMTVADDQFKSWKLYFEKCAKSAIYNTVANTESYMLDTPTFNWSTGKIYGGEYGDVNPIDTSNVCIAPYKNITFRCTIYVMSPQYSTIKKFDLLLVLKDFSEDATGEIDSSGSELTLAFSIVGENPSDVLPEATKFKITDPEIEKHKIDWTSIAMSASNSIIDIIQ